MRWEEVPSVPSNSTRKGVNEMKKATMLTVGLLMIAMVVGFGASAEAPLDRGYDPTFPPRDEGPSQDDGGGHFLGEGEGEEKGDEENGHRTLFNPPLKYVESWGGIVCPCPAAPIPQLAGNGPTNLR